METTSTTTATSNMTPYATALSEALKQGLLLLESAVTQPIGLTYDLRTAREALFPAPDQDDAPAEGGGLRRRVRTPVDQGLAALPIRSVSARRRRARSRNSVDEYMPTHSAYSGA